MQFNFAIGKMIQLDSDGFGKIDQSVLGNTKYVNNNSSKNLMLKTVIDTMGELSSKAQGLKSVITQYSRILSDQTIYIKAEGNEVYGFLKVGIKSLYYRDYTGTIKELRPLCVLDFYVHESVQRNGFGKMLFNYMLQEEKISPSKIAYGQNKFLRIYIILDRPSKLLFSFLRKHFNLVNYIPQNNNFVIFHQYFEEKQINNDQKLYQNMDTKTKINEKQLKESTKENLNLISKQILAKEDLQRNAEDKLLQTEKNQQTLSEKMKEIQLKQNYAEQFKNLQMSKQTAPWATNQIFNPMQTQSQQYGNFYTEKFNKPYY